MHLVSIVQEFFNPSLNWSRTKTSTTLTEDIMHVGHIQDYLQMYCTFLHHFVLHSTPLTTIYTIHCRSHSPFPAAFHSTDQSTARYHLQLPYLRNPYLFSILLSPFPQECRRSPSCPFYDTSMPISELMKALNKDIS